MVEFGTGYAMPMDREYGSARIDDNSTNDVGIAPIREVGFSVPFGIAAQNVQGVAAKIHTGARLIDLQIPGAARAHRNAQTPEVYGQAQRQALEELSRASNVEFTTHASFSVMGLAGMDQQGNFSKANKKFGLDEIKRAIEFAADVARGGNITIHTGEFQRPISEQSWATDPETGKLLFRSFKDEPEEAVFRIIDERNGQVAIQVRKNQRVARPTFLTAKPGEKYNELSGKDGEKEIYQEKTVREGETIFVDYEGKRVGMESRVPEYEKEKGHFKVDYWDWKKFSNEARLRTEEARRYYRERNENKGKAERWENSVYYSLFKEMKNEENIKVRPQEAYVWATLDTNAANARGWAVYYGKDFDQQRELLKKLQKAEKIYQKIEEGVPEDEQWRLLQEVGGELSGLIPREHKKPTEIIKDTIRSVRRNMDYAKEASTSQWQQANDTMESRRHMMDQERYALREAYDSYAQAGMWAFENWKKLKDKAEAGTLTGKKPEKPLFVAMEQIFPESYGGHPDEIIDLVQGGRKVMAQKLKQRGYSENEAREFADTHIKAHLDTGHINMWRKYWVGDEKISPEENDRRFNQWILGQVEKMAAKQMIGSVHLTDNYGYQDEHLAPGQGNGPVVDIVKILKKNGFQGPLIVEPGADAMTDLSDFHGLMKTWRLFGSSIYGAGTGQRAPSRQRAWSDVQYSYFGKGEPPYFVFGRYSPSEDWTLWSGVPME